MGIAVSNPIKWHGGKFYLASKIVAMMPPHVTYVEPYAGGLSVLLAKDPEGVNEIVNDLNGDLANFWRVLASEHAFAKFHRIVSAAPFSEALFRSAVAKLEVDIGCDDVDRAVAFFIACRQSMAGRMQSFAPMTKRRTRRGMNEQASAWLSAVEGLPEVHKRLIRVAILNRDALDVIRQHDCDEALFYLDPPYMHETRADKDTYRHEMRKESHAMLLETIKACKGKVMLSGYACEAYDAALAGWNRHEFDLPNNAAGGSEKRRMTECVWFNF